MRTEAWPSESVWMVEFRVGDTDWRPWDSLRTIDRDFALEYIEILRTNWKAAREFRLVEIRSSYYLDGEP